MVKGISWQLAEFAVGLRYEDLPLKVVQEQKDHLLDGLGNALHGATTELGRQVLAVVEALPTQGESTVWKVGKKVNCAQAAFANGTFANVAELEDGCHRTKLKPNSCLVQAGIAVAEREKAGGRDLLVGLIAGLEISYRIGEATHIGREGYARGWIATSSICQFGAAVVAGRLLGLNVEQMVDALGHAAAHPCGTWATGLTMAKRVAIGRAAENGILAAFMAAKGITAGDAVFDGEWGTIGSIISPVYEQELLTKELGEAWRTLRVGYKVSPTKGGVQSALDAMLEISQSQPDLQPEDIERILVRTTKGVAFNKAFATFPPKDFWEAQNSLPFILASAFIDRKFGLDQLADERLHDKRIMALASKVKLEHSEEADRQPPSSKTAFVDVFHRDGKVTSKRVDYPRGEPENPLTVEQLNAKFREVAKYGLDERGMAQVIQTVSKLEQLPNIRTLTAQLVSPTGFEVREQKSAGGRH